MINARVESALETQSANTKIRRVGIISRPRRADIARVVPPLIKWLQAHGAEVLCDSETGDCFGPLTVQTQTREKLPELADLLIVLGGDGTLLSAARLAADPPVPILAVNLGGLGFLTTVPLDDLYEILEEVFLGNNRVSERVMLEAQVVLAGSVIRLQLALTDASLNKPALARIMDVALHVDGEYVT